MVLIAMELVWLTPMGALAICFASCAVVLMLAFYFIARTSSEGIETAVSRKEPEHRPMDLETLRIEGYQVLEIYDDAEHWGIREGAPRGLTSERIIRTAKVRDPETGRICLFKVQTLVKPW